MFCFLYLSALNLYIYRIYKTGSILINKLL